MSVATTSARASFDPHSYQTPTGVQPFAWTGTTTTGDATGGTADISVVIPGGVTYLPWVHICRWAVVSTVADPGNVALRLSGAWELVPLNNLQLSVVDPAVVDAAETRRGQADVEIDCGRLATAANGQIALVRAPNVLNAVVTAWVTGFLSDRPLLIPDYLRR